MGYHHISEEDASKRNAMLVNTIKDYGEVMTLEQLKELSGLDIGYNGLKKWMDRHVIPANPEINYIPYKGYIYNDPKPLKNHEGYTDSTAAKAIANVMADAPLKFDYIPGEVWCCTTKPYDRMTFNALVLAVSKGSINYICVKELPGDKDYWDPDFCVQFKLKGKPMFVDIRKIQHCGFGRFAHFVETPDQNVYQTIMAKIAQRLNLENVSEPAPITKESAIEFLTKDGYLDELKNAIHNEGYTAGYEDGQGDYNTVAKALDEARDQLVDLAWDDGKAVEFLVSSGWMANHDEKLIESVERSHRDLSMETALLEQRATIYEEAFKLLISSQK